jgi:hypothetical protein
MRQGNDWENNVDCREECLSETNRFTVSEAVFGAGVQLDQITEENISVKRTERRR